MKSKNEIILGLDNAFYFRAKELKYNNILKVKDYFKLMNKSAVTLAYSYNPLKFPDGSIEKEVLEKLLKEAHERKLIGKELVVVTKHSRTKPFNPRDPTYHDVEYTTSVRNLKKLWRQTQGSAFKYEELDREQEERNAAKKFMRRAWS